MAAVLVFAALMFAAAVFAVGVLGLLFKLAIRVILFPLFLIKWIITALVMIVVGPVLAVVGLVLAVIFACLLAVPLVPLLVLGGLLWLLVRSPRRPAVV
jgi:hypothetical protein